jgi:hypothetical protein
MGGEFVLGVFASPTCRQPATVLALVKDAARRFAVAKRPSLTKAAHDG